MIDFFKRAFPVKKLRIIQGVAHAVLLCAINVFSFLLERIELSVWGCRLLFLLCVCMVVGFLWAGKLFLNLEIVGWAAIGYTAMGAALSFISPERFGKILLTGLCLVAAYLAIFYIIQKHNQL